MDFKPSSRGPKMVFAYYLYNTTSPSVFGFHPQNCYMYNLNISKFRGYPTSGWSCSLREKYQILDTHLPEVYFSAAISEAIRSSLVWNLESRFQVYCEIFPLGRVATCKVAANCWKYEAYRSSSISSCNLLFVIIMSFYFC